MRGKERNKASGVAKKLYRVIAALGGEGGGYHDRKAIWRYQGCYRGRERAAEVGGAKTRREVARGAARGGRRCPFGWSLEKEPLGFVHWAERAEGFRSTNPSPVRLIPSHPIASHRISSHPISLELSGTVGVPFEVEAAVRSHRQPTSPCFLFLSLAPFSGRRRNLRRSLQAPQPRSLAPLTPNATALRPRLFPLSDPPGTKLITVLPLLLKLVAGSTQISSADASHPSNAIAVGSMLTMLRLFPA